MDAVSNELLADFVREVMPELVANKDEKAVANAVSKLRWYPNKANAVVIVRRGADRKVLATISPNSGKWSHLYASWQPVLAELASRKETESVSRRTHDDLEMGSVPVSKEN